MLMSLGPAVIALAGYLVLDQALAPIQLRAIGLVIAASAGAVHTSNNNGLRPNRGDRRGFSASGPGRPA
jgi:inner membrane transporter RhtA